MIKNIVFDFGGVLLDLHYERTFEALSDLMGVALDRQDIPEELATAFTKYEKGLLQTETFMWNIQKHAAKQITEPHKIIKAWNAMLLGWNADRLPWLLRLKEQYRTFILSNTNELHIQWVRKDLKAKHGLEDFESTYFEHVYYSHDMGMRKPDAVIYEAVLAERNLVAGETLFIDDTYENVLAAQSVGIRAIHHDPSLEIIDQLPKYLLEMNRVCSEQE